MLTNNGYMTQNSVRNSSGNILISMDDSPLTYIYHVNCWKFFLARVVLCSFSHSHLEMQINEINFVQLDKDQMVAEWWEVINILAQKGIK